MSGGPPPQTRRDSPLESLFWAISTGARENLVDHVVLGIGVVLRVLPVLTSKLPFGAFVQLAIRRVSAQPVAEEQHAVDLLGSPARRRAG